MLLAAYTYVSGLRAPALIAFIKDTLIYVVIIVAIIYIPIKLGGWGHIFDVANTHLKTVNPKTGKPFGSLSDYPGCGTVGLRHARARLRARPVHVPARRNGDARRQEP